MHRRLRVRWVWVQEGLAGISFGNFLIKQAVEDLKAELSNAKAFATLSPAPLAAHCFLEAKDKAGRPVDPLARFHLGNGAQLKRLNFLGDVSPNGLRQAHGVMVDYLYDLGAIDKNHEALAETRRIAASVEVRRALPDAAS